MKTRLLTLLSLAVFSTSSFAYQVNLNLDTDKKVLSKFLDNAWEKVPRNISIGHTPIDTDDNENFDAEIKHGHISLGGAPKSKLFTLDFLGNNQVMINWNMPSLRVKMTGRVDFNYDIWIGTIRKHETILIDARRLNRKAKSLATVKFENGKFKLKVEKNINFSFDRIDVETDDDDILNWVIKQANKYVTRYLNQEVAKLINSGNTLGDIEDAANDALAEIENIDFDISEVATNLRPKFNKFSLGKETTQIGIDLEFSDMSQRVHECAYELAALDSLKGTIEVDGGMFEKVLENMTKFAVDLNNDGVDDQPLLCFGYDNYDAAGMPVGIDQKMNFELLGKELNAEFKMWVRPFTKPEFTFDKENQLIKLKLSAIVDVKNQLTTFPQVNLRDNKAIAEIEASVKISHDAAKGLVLTAEDLVVHELDSAVMIQFREEGAVHEIPFEKFRALLSKTLVDEIKKSVGSVSLVDKEIKFLNMRLAIKGFEISELGPLIKFEIK